MITHRWIGEALINIQDFQFFTFSLKFLTRVWGPNYIENLPQPENEETCRMAPFRVVTHLASTLPGRRSALLMYDCRSKVTSPHCLATASASSSNCRSFKDVGSQSLQRMAARAEASRMYSTPALDLTAQRRGPPQRPAQAWTDW